MLPDQGPLVIQACGRYSASTEGRLGHLVLQIVRIAVLVARGQVSSLLLAVLGLVHEHAGLARRQVPVLGITLTLQSSDK